MLFKRLFNWLKLKSLPSSVLFKNRLFVERDSKHRRIMSSWGLTFRNSKWTNYSLSNVSSRSITSFFKLLFSILFILTLIIILKSQANFYGLELDYNSVLYLYWSIKAQTSHIIFISFWSVYYLSNNLFNILFYKYLDKFFNESLKKTEAQAVSGNLKNTINNSNIDSIFKANILNNTSDKSLDNLQGIFENQNTHNSNIALILRDLYKITYLLSLHKNNHINFSVFSGNNTNTYTNTNYLKPDNKWSLDTISNKTNTYKDGLFYATDFNYRYLNTGYTDQIASTLSFDLQNQINMVGIQRFMFKYNPLHRSIMKGSITLTNTKKLLTPYNMSSDLSLKKTNIWLSQKNKHYDNFNKNATVKVSDSVENSYFFTLKRYYMFNKLSANQITTKFDLKVNKSDLNLNHVFRKHENWSTVYDNTISSLISESLLNRFDVLSISNNDSIKNSLINSINNIPNKYDNIINLEDNNLFNNSNDILLNYVDNITSLKTQLNVFNLYSNNAFYKNMMYDYSTLNNSEIDNHDFNLNEVTKTVFNLIV